MNFYKENLELFRNKIPILHETIINEKSIIEMGLEAIDDTLNYTATRDNKKCFIHSVFDINVEMEQMFKKVDKDVTTLIVFGLGCGYALNYVKENFKRIKNILIIEPSLEMFKIFMGNVKIYDEIKEYDNVTCVVNKDVQTAVNLLLNYIQDKISKPISAVYSISYRTIFEGYFEKINEALVDNISKFKLNMGTSIFFREQWTYNPIKNFASNAILIDNLFNKFEGKSAIIVSAGPSLNKNIHLLKSAKDKALIVTVGTASKILENNNIKPHLRFAMDSQKGEKKIFESLEEDNSILVYSDRVYHEIVPLFKRRLKMILDVDYLTRHIYSRSDIDFKTVNSGFSIANTAFDTLIRLGFKNIIFIGQDMCYTKDKLYAEGSWLEKNKIDLNNTRRNYVKVKDINGNEVYSEEGFLGVKTIFENRIAISPGVNYINATEGGIGINGTKIKTFQQVLDEDLIENYNFDDFFHDFFEKNIDNEDPTKIYNTIIKLENEIDEMVKINELRIKRIKKINRYLKKDLGLNKIEQEIVYLNKFEEDLKCIDFYQHCIKHMMDDIYKVLIFKYKYDGEDTREAVSHHKKAIECISYELKKYLVYLKTCIKDMKDNTCEIK